MHTKNLYVVAPIKPMCRFGSKTFCPNRVHSTDIPIMRCHIFYFSFKFWDKKNLFISYNNVSDFNFNFIISYYLRIRVEEKRRWKNIHAIQFFLTFFLILNIFITNPVAQVMQFSIQMGNKDLF